MNQLCITSSHIKDGHRSCIGALCCGRGWHIHEWLGLSVAGLVAHFLPPPTLLVPNALQPNNSRQI